MVSENKDVQLVAQARRGQTKARRTLYTRHAPVVRRACGGFSSFSHAGLEDVVQETFVKAFSSLDQLRDPKAFRSWTLSLERSQCLRRARKPGSEAKKVQAAKAHDITKHGTQRPNSKASGKQSNSKRE